MDMQVQDYNGADHQLWSYHADAWLELEAVVQALPLHLKASDQAGTKGAAIFDPVGTNEFFKKQLIASDWKHGIPIPKQFSFLGTHVDFAKKGTLLEVQFSNYPFLLNNTVRSELFFKAEMPLAGRPTELAIILTKAHMFPASNSTLYYEQAVKQLDELIRHDLFRVPIRVIGLFSPIGEPVDAVFTEYQNPRYSRTVVTQRALGCTMVRGPTPRSRAIPRVTSV